MNLLSAAERLAAIDRSAVILDAQRCLHALDKFSTCQVCFELCPENAIQPGKPPALQAEKCTACLACLPACPAGAFTADDNLHGLLSCAARLETRSLELVCSRHPAAHSGLPDTTAVQIRGCLAGLGASAYLSLVSLGLEIVVARIDACAACPWGSLAAPHNLAAQIQAQVAGAALLLGPWEKSPAVSCAAEPPEGGFSERPLWNVHNPPLSRRDLFRLASRQGQVAAARALASEPPSGGHRPPRERQRTLSALARFPLEQASRDVTLAGLGFARLSVSESCTACGVCVRACPTAALELENDGDRVYRLVFRPQACTACEICAHVCAPAALKVEMEPAFSQVFGQVEPQTLRDGEYQRCDRCNTLFAAAPGVRLCPSCEFRRANPFGSRMPPGARIAEKP